MFAPHGRRSPRKLRFELLENRALLAFGAFAINLYEDVGGQPGQVIASDTVHVGDSFFVEITAQDLLPEPRGLGGVHLRMGWDPQVLKEIDVDFDPSTLITSKFPAFQMGTLDQEMGRIDDLGGGAALGFGVGGVIGRDGPERFALLHFQALDTPGSSPFVMRAGSHGISHFPPVWGAAGNFTFEQQTITVLHAAPDPIVPSDVVAGQAVSSPSLSNPTTEPLSESAADVAADENTEPVSVEITNPVQEPTFTMDASDQDRDVIITEFAGPAQLVTGAMPEAEFALTTTTVLSPSPASVASTNTAPPRTTPVSHPVQNFCVAAPTHNPADQPTKSSLAPFRRGVQTSIRSLAFVGPLLPHEHATRLVLAQPASQLTSLERTNSLDDELLNLLASDSNPQPRRRKL